jgi:hypothetical protein
MGEVHFPKAFEGKISAGENGRAKAYVAYVIGEFDTRCLGAIEGCSSLEVSIETGSRQNRAIQSSAAPELGLRELYFLQVRSA